jgi:hypothetical protein
MINSFSKNSISIWNANTSIFTILIYILYFIIYRFDLHNIFAYLLLLFIIINLILIIFTLFITLKNKSELNNFVKIISFIIVRAIVNFLLIFLLLEYL